MYANTNIEYSLTNHVTLQSQVQPNLLYNLINHSISLSQRFTMDNCTLDCIQIMGELDYTQMCHFTQQQCIQDTVQFIRAYYCTFNGSFLMLIFLGVPLLFLLFKTLNVVTQYYLAPCVEEFIDEFKISPTLAGVSFLAFANGAPDVMTAIIAGSSDSDTTVMIPFGSIFGACLFSTAFILSTVIFSQPNQTLTVRIKQIALPLCFYIFGMLFIIMVTTIYGKMNMILALVLIAAYLIQIVLVVWSERKTKLKESLLQSGDQTEGQGQGQEMEPKQQVKEKPVEPEEKQQKKGIITKISDKVEQIQNIILVKIIPPFRRQHWNPINTIISLMVSPVILALTQQVPDIFTAFVGPISVFMLMCLPSLFLLCYAVFCIIRQQQPKYVKVFTIYAFLISIACLTVVVSILINLFELFQILTGINPVFLGLTVFAWANCMGDYFSITHFAKNGNPKTAVAGIFSGQLFNFLIGFGISLVMQSIDGEYEYKIFDFGGTTYDKISDSMVMLVIFAGLIYLIYKLVTVIIQKGVLMRRQARISRYYYFGFLGASTFLAVLTDFFNQIDCSMEGIFD